MAVPEIIPISYEPDYRTDTIGHWEGGQFLGSVVAAFPKGYTHTDDWQTHKRWHAVLHTFNAAGHHLDSRIERTGTDDNYRAAVDTAQERLKQWLNALPGLRYGDIAIRPFRHEVDDVLFGLVIETSEGTRTRRALPGSPRLLRTLGRLVRHLTTSLACLLVAEVGSARRAFHPCS
ncbi:hypothetical protein [Streptosporangium sp. NPDC051022]|uniref:hypothetical protein n=1 Tax=Streptosporangium sp. NPDC051022 TaxID=3155752 RepID=UPI00344845F1